MTDTNLHDLLIEHDELLAKLSDVLWNNGFNNAAREVDAAVERLHNFLAQADQAEANIERERQEAADQELEACCEWILNETSDDGFIANLSAARRPKPSSLKEQALQALNDAVKMADDTPPEGICSDQANIIRRALEQLDD